MKNIFTALFLLTLITSPFLATKTAQAKPFVKIKHVGYGTADCPYDNPRCFMSSKERNAAAKEALDNAKHSASYACYSKGGFTKTFTKGRTSCTKHTHYYDWYKCSGTYIINCDTNPNSEIGKVNSQEVSACVDDLEETTHKRYPNATNYPDDQFRSSCRYAVHEDLADQLNSCLALSLKGRSLRASYAMWYCDLALRRDELDDWVSILPFFEGYYLEYIYNEKLH